MGDNINFCNILTDLSINSRVDCAHSAEIY